MNNKIYIILPFQFLGWRLMTKFLNLTIGQLSVIFDDEKKIYITDTSKNIFQMSKYLF